MQHLQKTGGGGPPPFDVQTFRRADQGPIYPLYFLHLTALPTQRTLRNPFGINSLRTLFIATEGVPPIATLRSRLGRDVQPRIGGCRAPTSCSCTACDLVYFCACQHWLYLFACQHRLCWFAC